MLVTSVTRILSGIAPLKWHKMVVHRINHCHVIAIPTLLAIFGIFVFSCIFSLFIIFCLPTATLVLHTEQCNTTLVSLIAAVLLLMIVMIFVMSLIAVVIFRR